MRPSPETATPLPLLREVQPLLATLRFGRAVRGFREIGSTNTEAMAWAAEGAAEGSLVVAEHQTAGRGRQGRAWQAAAGQNLMCSLVLRPALPPAQLGLITLAASVAVAEAVAAVVAPRPVAIKWPNDVLVDGLKVAGMLLESALGGAEGAVVVLGIGLNVNQQDFPPALDGRATSLWLATGRPVPRAALLADLLGRLEARYASLAADGGVAVRQAYLARLAGLGQPIVVHHAGAGDHIEGRLDGITETGALRLATARGLRCFHAGDVTSHPPDSTDGPRARRR